MRDKYKNQSRLQAAGGVLVMNASRDTLSKGDDSMRGDSKTVLKRMEYNAPDILIKPSNKLIIQSEGTLSNLDDLDHL